ncbi:glycosyl transferase family 11 [Kineothrix alysoides]|uniref:Glycosyl transferase family 11 n=1 Tax=Kineothrix alysoides TaxID=1469948 RepID=A0A4R1R254_9FIRM|nr:alpha-1,2-fucosyltransferase [Kineothrix alysoides]TCL59398.1 glycosyl transferase family 11 [Kineothrix alysoides]
MIIIQVAGGLGNQMQQYALYRKLISLGMDARLDISWFTECSRQDGVYARRELELNYFEGLEYEACTEEEKRAVIGSEGLLDKVRGRIFPSAKRVFYEKEMYHPEIFKFDNKYLCGYFACEKYYADILDSLRESIKFPASSNPQNEKAAIQIRSQESVSVHIRRGDYLDTENIEMFGNICTEDYYKGAIEELKHRYPKARFYLFSDDETYVRERYTSEEYTVVNWNKGSDSFYDMWLMSLCRHNICANSTFSFWGARLNANPEKIMIRPSIHKNSQKFDSETMHELWEGWILLNNKGEIV